jgi:hypothetical protein
MKRLRGCLIQAWPDHTLFQRGEKSLQEKKALNATQTAAKPIFTDWQNIFLISIMVTPGDVWGGLLVNPQQEQSYQPLCRS